MLVSFLDTDIILQTEIKRGKICTARDKADDKVLRSVLLSSHRILSATSVSFFFLNYVLFSKNISGLQPKAPFNS